METEEVVYFILQDKYLKNVLGKDDYTEEEIMTQSHKLFPNDWAMLDSERKIKLIVKAINENRNLCELYDEEIDSLFVSTKSETK